MGDAPATPDEALSIGRRISMLAHAHPDLTAIIFAPVDGPERHITWRELDDESNRVARLLAQHGVDGTVTVVVGLRNSPEHFFACIAGWKLGACMLPLRWDLPAWEREPVLAVSGANVAVADWDGGALTVLTSADVAAARELSAEPLPDRISNPAHAIATSGATGRPKVIITPRPGVYDAQHLSAELQEYLHTHAGQVQLIPAPLYHTNGFRISHGSLLDDQLIVVMERFSAVQAADLIERHRVNVMTMVPTMLMRIARLDDIRERDFSSLDAVLQGGACCPQWLVRAWFDLVGPEHFFVAYGSSEGIGLTMVRGDEWRHHPGTVGRGVGAEVRVLDDDGNDLPSGEVGEIYMRSMVYAEPTYEYRGAPPAKTAADGFVTVGDLGWLDKDGYLYIADRRADMIVSGGANVYPAEVEAALSEHPAVGDVVVIGLPDDEWGRIVHAVIEPADPSAPPSIDELQHHCRERLTPYKVPKSFELVDRLPRSEAGKINRSALVAARATASTNI